MDSSRLNSFSLLLLFIMCSLNRQACALTKLYVEDRCSPSTNYELVYDVDSPFFGSSSSRILQSSKYGGYKGGLDCTLRLRPGSAGVILTVQKIDFRSLCIDSIKIENSYGVELATFCGNEYIPSKGKSYYTSGDMIIRYKTGNTYASSLFKGFEVLFTGYRSSFCLSDEFECDNLKCIWNGFTCDGYNHCGDNSDQENCVGTMRVGSFIGVFIACIIVASVITIAAVCIRRRRRITVGTVMTSPVVAPPPPPYGAQYPPPQFITQYPSASPAYQGVHPTNQSESVNPLYK